MKTLRHFIDTNDFTKEELLDIIHLSRRSNSASKQAIIRL